LLFIVFFRYGFSTLLSGLEVADFGKRRSVMDVTSPGTTLLLTRLIFVGIGARLSLRFVVVLLLDRLGERFRFPDSLLCDEDESEFFLVAV
jgi:hypothetical protein